MRLIDADALIEFCAERWIPLNIDAVNMQPTIQPEKAQLSKEGTTSDFSEPTRIIPETRAIPSDDDRVSLSEKVTATFYDDEYEEWSQKTVTVRDVLDAVCDEYTVLPPAQPEPAIPLSWIGKYIEWLKSFDNEFANLAAAHISVMVKKWRDEQNATD